MCYTTFPAVGAIYTCNFHSEWQFRKPHEGILLYLCSANTVMALRSVTISFVLCQHQQLALYKMLCIGKEHRLP